MSGKKTSKGILQLTIAGIFLCLLNFFFFLAGQDLRAQGNVPLDSIIDDRFIIGQNSVAALPTLETPILTLDNSAFLSQETSQYTSEIFSTAFTFNGLGLRFRGEQPPGTFVRFFVRVEEASGWTGWLPIELLRDAKEKTDGHISEPIFFQKGKKLQYRIELSTTNSQTSPQIDQIEWLYFDTEENPVEKFSRKTQHLVERLSGMHQALAEEALKIITRTEWGADETFRYNALGKEIWPAKTADVKKFIVHHTAGGSGGSDPQATIRGIYYWHAQVLGWGDIGYNYLIDQNGNMYEGRFGGEGVIGGHTFNSATNTNYNEGSIGIAVLGCFETTSGACPTTHAYSETIQKTFIKLIGAKAAVWKINALGESEWFGRVVPNIVGHGDVDQTYCPGNTIHEDLPNIRELTAKGVTSQENLAPYSAGFVGHDLRDRSFIGDRQTVTVRFKNTGDETWGKHATYLEIFDDGYGVSRYRDELWTNEFGRVPFEEQEVKTGEQATFIFSMKTPTEPGEFKTLWRIKPNDHEAVSAETSVTTRADSHYQASLISHNVPEAILNVWRPTVTLKIKNIGHATWNRGLVAEIVDDQGNSSVFTHSSWPNKTGLIPIQERSVSSDQTATIQFRLQPLQKPGTYPLTIRLRLKNNNTPVQYGTFPFFIRVDELKK